MDLIIKNGTVITSSHTYERIDIGIEKGRMSCIGHDLDMPSSTIIDATDLTITSGIVDVHTHIDHWGGTANTEDTFFSSSKAAVYGGTTTFMDFAIQREDENVKTAYLRRLSMMKESSIDYGLHAHVTEINDNTLGLIREMANHGVHTYTAFLTYKAAGFKIEDPDLLRLFSTASLTNSRILIHAEDDSICETLTQRMLHSGHATVTEYPISRPPEAEIEAISRSILFSTMTQAPIYIVHVTTAEGVRLIREAQAQGVDVKAETCTHYLCLDATKYEEPDGYKYIMAPPLRSQDDIDALWEGLLDGTLSAVSSDHCDYSLAKKITAKNDFSKVSPGLQGIEYLGPVVTELARRRGIARSTVMTWLATQPAEIFGLKNKGDISIGNDADLVIWNDDVDSVVTDTNHHMASDYSPYKGMQLRSIPQTVVSRGQIVMQDRKFVGARGEGQLLTSTYEV